MYTDKLTNPEGEGAWPRLEGKQEHGARPEKTRAQTRDKNEATKRLVPTQTRLRVQTT